MDETRRLHEIAARWPRLREEAHALHVEVQALRERERELVRELALERRRLQRANERLQRANERLEARVDQLQRQLDSIVQSLSWRILQTMRRLLRGRPAARPVTAARPPTARAVPGPKAPPPRRPSREEVAKQREQAAEQLSRWVGVAQEARGPAVVVIVGTPSDERVQRVVAGCLAQGAPVVHLDSGEGINTGLLCRIPQDIEPSLVPVLLAADLGDAPRLFVALAPEDAALRWLVPAQQEGWIAVADVADDGPLAVYLTTHADAAYAASVPIANRLEAVSGRSVAVLGAVVDPIASYLDRAASSEPPLPRRLLGIVRP